MIVILCYIVVIILEWSEKNFIQLASIAGVKFNYWYHCKRNHCVLSKAEQRSLLSMNPLCKLFQQYRIEICGIAYEIGQPNRLPLFSPKQGSFLNMQSLNSVSVDVGDLLDDCRE